MSEKDYIEQNLRNYLSEQYDKFMQADEKVKSTILSEYTSKDDYINKNLELYKKTTLDGEDECLSEEEINFIQHCDSNAKQSSGDLDAGIVDVSKEIVKAMNRDAELTVSVNKNGVLFKRGYNKFELSNREMVSLLNQLNTLGMNNLYDTSKGFIDI